MGVFCGRKRRSEYKTVVLMSDFGLKDGAVGSMKGVILSVDDGINVSDLTHFITPFDIHEASYRLYQSMVYYPKGSVFVCVVDPGVGTERKSIVALTKNGYYIVTPDNGTISYIAREYGISEIREICGSDYRLPGSYESYTFHGRDVYCYTGAKLAIGRKFESIGDVLGEHVSLGISSVRIEGDEIAGGVVVLDGDYGNIWTNINVCDMEKIGIGFGESVGLRICSDGVCLYDSELVFERSFGYVEKNEGISYVNSLGNFSVAINQGNFSKEFGISSGSKVF